MESNICKLAQMLVRAVFGAHAHKEANKQTTILATESKKQQQQQQTTATATRTAANYSTSLRSHMCEIHVRTIVVRT